MVLSLYTFLIIPLTNDNGNDPLKLKRQFASIHKIEIGTLPATLLPVPALRCGVTIYGDCVHRIRVRRTSKKMDVGVGERVARHINGLRSPRGEAYEWVQM